MRETCYTSSFWWDPEEREWAERLATNGNSAAFSGNDDAWETLGRTWDHVTERHVGYPVGWLIMGRVIIKWVVPGSIVKY